MVCGTRAPVAARAFADVARGKRLSKFPKFFILFASNSKRCNMQMSHFHESGVPFKNCCKLAKQVETIRNYRKWILVMIKYCHYYYYEKLTN